MKRLLIATFMATALILAPAGNILAQEGQTNTVSDIPFKQRCEVIKEKLTKKISVFEKRREAHLRYYKSIHKRVVNITERLDNQGYDTKPIKVLLPGLEKRINLFSNNSEQFITDLKQARRAVCVSPERYQEELQQARESLKKTRRSAKVIATFVQEEIIPTIRKVVNNPPSDEAISDSTE
jgi:hypothetical protein